MESPTLLAKRISNERKHKGLPVYDGGLGENPMPLPKELHDELIKWSHDKTYKPVDGLPSLRDGLIDKYTSEDYKPTSVVIGNGLKELIFINQLVFNGTTIIISPYWVSYTTQCQILNKSYKVFETSDLNNYKIEFDVFNKFISKIKGPKLLIFNNPSNPTGIIYEEDEVEQLAKICKKHNIIVLEDEIYVDLIHKGYKTCSISKYHKLTVRGNSISKNVGCGGYRLGWLTFPDELRDLSNKIKSYSSSIYSCASSPMHYVALKTLCPSTELKQFIDKTVDIFTDLSLKIQNILINNSQIGYTKSVAAWYMILDFIKYKAKLKNKFDVINDKQLQVLLIEKIGFILVPGSSFGIHEEKLCMRYSHVDLDENLGFSRIEEGLNKLCNFLEN
jgi:aspartate/methionine/tyrosine aminotransferase